MGGHLMIQYGLLGHSDSIRAEPEITLVANNADSIAESLSMATDESEQNAAHLPIERKVKIEEEEGRIPDYAVFFYGPGSAGYHDYNGNSDLYRYFDAVGWPTFKWSEINTREP